MKRYLFVSAFLLIGLALSAQEKKWTLKECVNYAIENNLSVKQARFDAETAKQDVVDARGNFLPSVSASASHTYNFGSFIDQNGGRISIDSRGNSFSIGTGVTIFNGFRNTNLYKQSKLGLKSSQIQLDILTDNMSLNIANAYLNILLNKENLKIALEQIEVTQKQLNQAKAFVESGVRARSTILEVEAQLATDNERLVNARNSVDLALLNLAQLLQITHKGFDVEDVLLEVSSLAIAYNNSDDIYNVAETKRPEIKRANLDIENSDLSIEISKSAFLPSLSFSAGAGTSYQHSQGQRDVRPEVQINDPNDPSDDVLVFVPNGFGRQLEDNLGYNLGFSLSIPIFSRFKNKANVSKARINREKSELRLEEEKQTLRSNIEQAFADAKAALNQYLASESSVKLQQDALQNAQERYTLGVINSFDFEQIRNRLINAQASLINAKYNFVFKTKVLDFYMGKSLTN
ncbi:TolC family protein [Flavivirga eckloniae]|uniref:TolC family protein n=1 Tax=Flavivirga eckloniae TaxID=1803846 RepID=A0A2K9PPB2_9FLAO|nr:TolC family protein [Flavivirga eckloniae]AUP78875.1 TolC family protein [Flavivirga eckloniae]